MNRCGTGGGAVVLALTVYWAATPLPPAQPLAGRYGGNAVLALELAQTVEDVEAVIGPDDAAHASLRARFDDVQRLDFVYILSYGCFLACAFLIEAARAGDRRLALGFRWGAAAAIVAALADVVENVALLATTKSGAAVADLLPALRASTLLKWELLAVLTTVLAFTLWREGGAWRRMCAILGAAALPCGVLAIVDGATWGPLLVASFIPVWLAVFARGLADAWRPAKTVGATIAADAAPSTR